MKSTGPPTERGKARVALNPLTRGQRVVALQERLARAGYRDGEALYRRIRSRISRAFATPVEEVSLHIERRADRLANWIWAFRRELQRWEARRAKLECALESVGETARLSHRLKDCDKLLRKSLTDCFLRATRPPLPGWPPLPPATQFRVRDSYRRIGIVFYAQQRRHFTARRSEAQALGLAEFEPPSGALEQGLRCRVHRLARPRMWERLRFCLDKGAAITRSGRRRFGA